MDDGAWVVVTDPQDPRLDPYRSLRDAAARRSYETAHGLFVVEGPTVVRRLVRSTYTVRSLLVLPKHAAALDADGTLGAVGDAAVLVADRSILAAVAGFDVHRGVLAIAERRPPSAPADVLAGAELVAVLEGLSDAENLGAVVRSANALGVDALLLDPTCIDPLYRRTVRVSMGEALFIPWARLDPWPARLDVLTRLGFTVIALTPSNVAPRLDDLLGSLAGPVAFLLGAEGPGLTAGALEAADHHARIPQRPGADSLNVGHAAAIAFHLAGRAERPAPERQAR